jgi:hypothetical protein
MHQEPAQELLVGKSHGAVLALVGVVFPAKSYAVVVDAKQTVVGNGDSMGVTGQVLQNVPDRRTAAWRKPPIAYGRWFRETLRSSFRYRAARTPQRKPAWVAKRLLQAVSEFASKNTAEHFHWEEEAGSRADPASVIR